MNRLLLVHGAFHGAWCWEKLTPELDRRGIVHDAVELPFTTPEADVAEVRAAMDRLGSGGSDVTILGHSFGGAVISAAAALDGTPYGAATSLIYLTAIVMAPGQSVDFSGAPGMAAIEFDGEEARFDRASARSAFYHCCTEQDASWATERLRPMPAALLTSPPPARPAWQVLPSTYILCTEDRILSTAAQSQMAANTGSTVTIGTDHSPFLSRPSELADLIAAVLA